MNMHSSVNLGIQIETYQARLCLTFIGQVPSLVDAVVKTTKISKALQATLGGPSDGAGTVWSQFGTVQYSTPYIGSNSFEPNLCRDVRFQGISEP